MKTVVLLLNVLVLFQQAEAQYNNMWIPDTLSGTVFNLNIKDTFAQIKSTGNQTITGGINGKFLGPTLLIQKGDTVHLNVHNFLNDSTTLHWHGMHLPAVMDGGPHQVIPPGTIWQPYWKVTNNASTLWYHPHLHEMTMEQLTKGIGGMIIVRDSIESALALPRKYGVDDIPLILTDRDFNPSTDQFDIVPYGDSMLTNMTLRARYDLPAQVVRLRILNAAIERSYNIGLSNDSTFYVIASDGGLLNSPVGVTRYLLSAGERIEILLNLTGKSGSLDLKAYNSTLSNRIPGGENFVSGPFANFLGKKDFNILHIDITSPTSYPITTIPASLTTNIFPGIASANLTRIITFSDSTGVTNPVILGPNAFILDHKLFDINYINYTVPLNNTEIWELRSTSVFAHPFHIHDVQFYILSRNGVAPPAYEQGWKDVVMVKSNEIVRFITRFEDYSDILHPFMYHCHISLHEDEGMMGQFVVSGGIIPLSLTSFTAQLITNAVLLNWISEQQLNINSYQVERSGDGVLFEPVGVVAASQNSREEYCFTDHLSNMHNGVIYYRLKIAEKDGTYSYSPVRMIRLSPDPGLDYVVYPNPAGDRIYIQFSSFAARAYYVWIYDNNGRALYMLPEPALTDGIDISKLLKGVYSISIMDQANKEIVSKKFIKQ